MRQIDENYWKDYFDTHNDRRFDDLVNDFYTDDAAFENPKIQVIGRDQLTSFCKAKQSRCVDRIDTLRGYCEHWCDGCGVGLCHSC
jgi:hypothetical protein